MKRLSRSIPYQKHLHSLNALPSFSEKPLFFTLISASSHPRLPNSTLPLHLFLGAPRCGSGPNWCLEGRPPIPNCNWRTLPSTQSPSLPALPSLFPPPPLALFAMFRESGTGRPSLVWGEGCLWGVEGEGPPAALGARPTSGGTRYSCVTAGEHLRLQMLWAYECRSVYINGGSSRSPASCLVQQQQHQLKTNGALLNST